MGTNYYAIVDLCDCCGRSEKIHICKSLVTFEGHPDEGLTSWQAWRARLLAGSVARVETEYGDHLTVDEFCARVEATDPARRRRQYDWVQANARYALDRSRDYLDADGFSFYDGEFS